MTQEELDAIMAGELDFESEPLSDEVSVLDSDLLAPSRDVSLEDVEKEEVVTPPPATREHRVVEQLDDVTRDSEEKAGEIFDALEGVMGDVVSNMTGDYETGTPLCQKRRTGTGD